jgi:hypothetical protein
MAASLAPLLQLSDLSQYLIIIIYSIPTDLRETGCRGMDWIYLAQDRDQWRALVNTVMNLRIT